MAQSINSGTEIEILNVALNTSTDVQVILTKKPNNILIRNRVATDDLYVRIADNASEYFTIPEGQSLTIDVGAKVFSPIWLRAETGTPDAEILVSYD